MDNAARIEFEKAIELKTDYESNKAHDLYYDYSWLFVIKRDFRKVIEVWESRIQLDPKLRYYITCGSQLRHLLDYTSKNGPHYKEIFEFGKEYLEKAISLDNKNVNAIYELGLLYKKVDYKKSLDLFKEGMKLDHENWHKYDNEIFIVISENEGDGKVIECFNQKVKNDPKTSESSFATIALIYEINEQYKKALEYYKRAMDLSKNKYVYLNSISRITSYLGDIKKAIKICLELLDLENKPHNYLYISDLYLEDKDKEGAEIYLDLGLEMFPEDYKLNIANGDYWFNNDHYDKAINNYKKIYDSIIVKNEKWWKLEVRDTFDLRKMAIQKKPNQTFIKVCRNLAASHLRKKEMQYARDYIQEILEIEPHDMEMKFVLGQILFEIGKQNIFLSEKIMGNVYKIEKRDEINSELQNVKKINEFIEANIKTGQKEVDETPITVPKTTFKDIGGLAQIKKELSELINTVKKQEKGLINATGILLYGPPGCGKTILAKAVAGELKIPFHHIKIRDVFSKWVGGTQKNIVEILNRARKDKPAVIFFDELEIFGLNRIIEIQSHERQLINQMLMQINTQAKVNKGLIFIGATVDINTIDFALRRPGRFGKHIFIPKPNQDEREQIFKIQSTQIKVTSDINFNELAKQTKGATGADIKEISSNASITARNIFKRSGRRADQVLQSDFQFAIDNWKKRTSISFNPWRNR
jgi:SpoVK/Ycf46/Vps4 family AAA+-type ATPase